MSLKLKDKLEISGFHTVVQKAIVTNLLESRRQDMQKETAYEFLVFERNLTSLSAGIPASGREGSLCFCHRENPAVGDGNLMSVASKILNSVAEAIKGLFDERAPVLRIETVLELIPGIGIKQFLTGRRKNKPAIVVAVIQQSKKLALEFITQYANGNKEGIPGPPELSCFCKAAAGNDAVHMDMVIKFLVPGMQNLNDTGCCSEILFIQ